MKRFLTTPKIEGSFDFFSNLIVLDRYSINDKDFIQLALQNSLSTQDVDVRRRARNTKSLLVHEVTHFLDLTTTVWGLEYIIRKLNVLEDLSHSRDYVQSLSVLMLNISEIELHREHLVFDKSVELNTVTTFSHALKYDERLGAFAMIYYAVGDKRIHSVPLSMLSVLEANAIANEWLSKLNDIDAIDDPIDRKISIRELENEFEKLFEDPERSEYTVILNLCRIHYVSLEFRELLELISALVKFTLNASNFLMTSISYVIEGSIKNDHIGSSFCLDMRRGMSRHLLLFKTILMMYDWLEQIDTAEKDNHLSLLKKDPLEAIHLFWERLGVKDFGSSSSLQFEVFIQVLNEKVGLREAQIILECFQTNCATLKSQSPGNLLLSDLKLMDVFLSDDTVITMPNRVEIDILDYFDSNCSVLSRLDKICREKVVEKFHIPPGLATATFSQTGMLRSS